MPKERTNKTKMQNKRGKITSPRNAPTSDTTMPSQQNFSPSNYLDEGLALRSAFRLSVASPVKSMLSCSSSLDLLWEQTSSLALEPQSRQQDA